MPHSIKVLIVDDSAFMRKAISKMLESDPAIEIVATARDGEECLEKIKNLKPDLVTLDVEMPRMDGLTALRIIMEEMPLPVLMISSLTEEGAQATLDALELGAVDFIPKQLSYVSLDIVKIKEELTRKVKAIAGKKFFFSAKAKNNTPVASSLSGFKGKISAPVKSGSVEVIAIGSSTGGPPALQAIIPLLPSTLPVGVLVVQHMPKAFTGPFAKRLDNISRVKVKEAEKGDIVKPGQVLIAPGDLHMIVDRKRASAIDVELTPLPSDVLHKPSVDVMMSSVAKAYGGHSLGVILTGMGSDGTEGMRDIKLKGGKTIAQDEESCVVFGMPKMAIEAEVIDKVVPLPKIAEEIVHAL